MDIHCFVSESFQKLLNNFVNDQPEVATISCSIGSFLRKHTAQVTWLGGYDVTELSATLVTPWESHVSHEISRELL